jgi:hypothetical protein
MLRYTNAMKKSWGLLELLPVGEGEEWGREGGRDCESTTTPEMEDPADAPTNGEGQSGREAAHKDVQTRSALPPYSWDPALRCCTWAKGGKGLLVSTDFS